jgi:hypothetical protein
MVANPMPVIIKLTSDLGELRVWLATVILSEPLNEELLSKVRGAVYDCANSLITVVPADRVLGPWQMIYPAYLSLRDHITHSSKIRDPGLAALTYMAGTTRLSKGLSILSPIGHDKLSIVIMGINDCVADAVNRVVDLLREHILDLVIGVGIYRLCNCIFPSMDEFINTLISEYMDEFT